jgi:hypothetical protein
MFDFLKLEWKKFTRSKNFTQNLFKKIFLFFAIFITGLYISGLIIGSYFIIKNEFPQDDVFKKLNSYLYVLFFLIFYILSFVSIDTFEVRPLMILPIKKKKIIHYYLSKVLLHPFNLVILIDLLILSIILINHPYNSSKIIIWYLSLVISIVIINLLLLMVEKNQYLMAVSSVLLFVLVTNFNKIKALLEPMGEYFYNIYSNPLLAIPLWLGGIAVYYYSFSFFKKKFYLDSGIETKKKKTNLIEKMGIDLKWTEKYGKTGSFIKNDIRLITRNPRTKQLLYSSTLLVLFGILILTSDTYKENDFMIIYWAFMLTGYFIMSFGALVPSWDGKYYKLLMSQNIRYKEYLEAKWWFMVVSVVFMTLISLPLILIKKDFFWILITMAILNIGFHTYTVLLTGLLNKKAIDLDQKVKAFQNNQDFNGKIFIYSLLRLIIPVSIFLIIEKMAGITYAAISLSLIGVLGIIFKNFLLEKISRLYAKQKYNLIESYYSEDD